MRDLSVSKMTKLEIVVEGQYREVIVDLLDRAGVGGYTIFHNLSGKGTHGTHRGHLMFNDDSVLVMITSAVQNELVDPIMEGLTPFFEKHMGLVFASEVRVGRMSAHEA